MKKKGMFFIVLTILTVLFTGTAYAEELPVIVVPKVLAYQHKLMGNYRAVEVGDTILVENEKGIRIPFSACEPYLKDGKKGLETAFFEYLKTAGRYPKKVASAVKSSADIKETKQEKAPAEEVKAEEGAAISEEEALKELLLLQQQTLTDIAALQEAEPSRENDAAMENLSLEYNRLEMEISGAAESLVNASDQETAVTEPEPAEELALAEVITPESVKEDVIETYGLELSLATPGYIYTTEELVILAQVMRHEAGNQCREGQIAVVEVILNRMFSPYFPNTVAEVVYAPHQFSYVERSKTIEPTQEELALVREVVSGQARVLCDPRILYYKNQYICDGVKSSTPMNWGRLEWVTYIEDHAFFIDPKKG